MALRQEGLQGLSWRTVFMAWDKRIVSMAEHLVHILECTYATQCGLDSTSAGLSVKTKNDITTATCQKYERHLANTSHWPHNLTATQTRTVDMRDSIASLPAYFNVEQDLRLTTVRRKELARELEMAKQEQTRLQAQERASSKPVHLSSDHLNAAPNQTFQNARLQSHRSTTSPHTRSLCVSGSSEPMRRYCVLSSSICPPMSSSSVCP